MASRLYIKLVLPGPGHVTCSRAITTEQVNASMEQYLGVFVKHQQDDWMQWLPCAEFTANDGVSESMKCNPFIAVQGVDPRMSIPGDPIQERDQQCLDADQIQDTMPQIHDHVQFEMRRSQALQDEGSNQGRMPAPNIHFGSQV